MSTRGIRAASGMGMAALVLATSGGHRPMPLSAIQPVAPTVESTEQLPGLSANFVATRVERHLAFDTSIYPGDDALHAWQGRGSPYQ
ncbi:MAG: hypothetical protein M3081_20045 [Gemmatimonadota bacterium]|nr:hypothetical protein [Gemmatimonadota bacterium]